MGDYHNVWSKGIKDELEVIKDLTGIFNFIIDRLFNAVIFTSNLLQFNRIDIGPNEGA